MFIYFPYLESWASILNTYTVNQGTGGSIGISVTGYNWRGYLCMVGKSTHCFHFVLILFEGFGNLSSLNTIAHEYFFLYFRKKSSHFRKELPRRRMDSIECKSYNSLLQSNALQMCMSRSANPVPLSQHSKASHGPQVGLNTEVLKSVIAKDYHRP